MPLTGLVEFNFVQTISIMAFQFKFKYYLLNDSELYYYGLNVYKKSKIIEVVITITSEGSPALILKLHKSRCDERSASSRFKI